MIPAVVSSKNAKSYTVSAGPVFKFEAEGEYVYIDNWFEQLGKSTQKWLDDIGTKRLFERVGPLVDGPVLMPQVTDVDTITSDEKAEKKKPVRVAVNKYVISVVLGYLGNNKLKQLVSENMPINVLVANRCDSLHIRTTDGWLSVSQVAKHLKFEVDAFVKSEQLRNLVGMFGPIVSADPVPGDEEKSVVWMHPVGLLPMLLWIDTPAALELMATYFMTNTTFMPNLDAMVPLIAKNMKLRAQAKAKQESAAAQETELPTLAKVDE